MESADHLAYRGVQRGRDKNRQAVKDGCTTIIATATATATAATATATAAAAAGKERTVESEPAVDQIAEHGKRYN